MVVKPDTISKSEIKPTLVPMFSLQDAAKKVNELITLKRDHPEIPRLRGLIDKSLEMYKMPTIDWLDSIMYIVAEKVDAIRDYFYDPELPNLVWSLSFDKLGTLLDSYVKAIVYITAHVKQSFIRTT